MSTELGGEEEGAEGAQQVGVVGLSAFPPLLNGVVCSDGLQKFPPKGEGQLCTQITPACQALENKVVYVGIASPWWLREATVSVCQDKDQHLVSPRKIVRTSLQLMKSN